MWSHTDRESVSKLTDEALIERVQGEPWLFAVVLERYQQPFLRKAQSILRNEQDAEEVVQDAFTKIYMYAHRFEVQQGARFSSWAYKILMNTAFTRYQKSVRDRKYTMHLDPEIWELQGARTEHSGFAEDRDGIERIFAKMPGHFAHVLRLHYLEHWSHKDIAKSLNETAGAVKARLHRARAAFRKEADTQTDASLL